MPAPLVLTALRDPEAFAADWADRASPATLGALIATASVGVASYGAAMHAWEGALAMALHACTALVAAGGAWTASIPALYVLGTLSGSRLSLRAVVLASLVTVSFGGLAMLASIPVLWFFELCLPYTGVRWLVNLAVFAGVGLSMADVFVRVVRGLEGLRFLHFAWLGLLSVVGAELFAVLGLFSF